MITLNNHIDSVKQSGTVALADRVRQLERQGKRIIPLHTGDPDFNTPALIIEASARAIQNGLTHYSNSRGLTELREAISEYLKIYNNASFDPGSEILVTQGGIHAYFLALTSIINEGDEVLIPDPTWMSHPNIIKLVGGIPIPVASSGIENLLPSIEDLERKISSHTKAVVINSPGNPTGEIATKEYFSQLMQLAERHDLFIISDEVYDQFVFEGSGFCSATSFPEAKHRLILINSFSKTFAMTGWRIGYLAAPKNIIDNALKVSQSTITNVVPFIQKAALEGLTNKAVWPEVEKMRKQYEWRANEVMKLFSNSKNTLISFKKPKGAFYFFIDIRKLNWGNSEQTAARILDELSIAVVPGTVFGQAGEGYVRATFAAADELVLEGFSRLLNIASA
ncbi:MAG: pyridoxal phosphate-dependent aminotransferase [Ferruginibacter sp.]